uniref:Uncharacterized protein n=1 Tax=Mus musculus TaxID=10090 RepID=Q3V3M9_MOUSE|nr:unnamed protein product [Mus musculus]
MCTLVIPERWREEIISVQGAGCVLWDSQEEEPASEVCFPEYTVAVFRCTRRGHQISLSLEEQSVLLTTEPSLQPTYSLSLTYPSMLLTYGGQDG